MGAEFGARYHVVEKWFSEGKLLETSREDLLKYLQICITYGYSGRHLTGDPGKHKLIANAIIFRLNELQSIKLENKIDDLKSVAADQKLSAVNLEKLTQSMIEESVKLNGLTTSMVDESKKLSKQTDILIKETRFLKWWTIGLAVMTLVLVIGALHDWKRKPETKDNDEVLSYLPTNWDKTNYSVIVDKFNTNH